MGDQVEQPDVFAHFQILDFSNQAGTRIDVAICTHMDRETFRLAVHVIMKLFVVHVTSLGEQVDRSLTVSRLLIPSNPENCTLIVSTYPLVFAWKSSSW